MLSCNNVVVFQKLESTEKESKILDLEISQLQLKIQECLDKAASNDRVSGELVNKLSKKWIIDNLNYKFFSYLVTEKVTGLKKAFPGPGDC